MKIKNGFMLREVAGNNIVVPVGATCNSFNGMINLNDTGAFLWGRLSSDTTESELLSAMLAEYDVPEDIARRDIASFVENLRNNGLLSE